MDDDLIQEIKVCIGMHEQEGDVEDAAFYTGIYARILKRENALASTQIGWLRAIDEAMVVSHIGVANADDSYETAKEKLNNLICFHTDVATDSAVNGGFKLVPVEQNEEIERLRAKVTTLTETIEAARTAMSAAPAWHEMHRVAIDQLKMAKYVTETDYMEEPT
jgi:hypothetical protein